GGDPFEVRSHVGPEASEVELSVVLDPTQGDLGGGTIAALALRAADREAIQDVLCLLLEQSLDEGKVVDGLGSRRRLRLMTDALGELSHRYSSRSQILHERRMAAGLAG